MWKCDFRSIRAQLKQYGPQLAPFQKANETEEKVDVFRGIFDVMLMHVEVIQYEYKKEEKEEAEDLSKYDSS